MVLKNEKKNKVVFMLRTIDYELQSNEALLGSFDLPTQQAVDGIHEAWLHFWCV